MAYGEGIGGRIRLEIDWIYDAIGEDNGNYLYNIDIMSDALNKIASDADKIEEEKKKYAWHDLRKNPDDLPEEEECVVLVSMNGRFGHIEYRHAAEDGYWIKGESFFAEKEKNKLVEAWKYIEPFEVSE